MKTIALLSRRSITSLITISCLCFCYFLNFELLAGESITIGYSNHSAATAYSSGRRIVRTLDDRRVVVYQDSLDGEPAVVCVRSDDGVTWSMPQVVVKGAFPALAVSDENWIYLVWSLADGKGIGLTYSQDGALTWERQPLFIQIKPAGAIACQFPVIEATTNAVHVAWQQQSASGAIEKICYQRFRKDLADTLTPMLTLSADSSDSRFPVLAGDLEFEKDLIHLVWCEYPVQPVPPRLFYCSFIERAGSPNWGFSQPEIIPQSFGKVHPSISVRNFEFNDGKLGADIIMACADHVTGNVRTAWLQYGTSGLRQIGADSIAAAPNSLPSVDDIYILSCAIVWRGQSNILYGQTANERIMTIPPIPVNAGNSASGRNPNVCYKTFRRDSLDVVWIEGEQPPYRVMYRRLAKQYEPVAVDDARKPATAPTYFELSQNHPNPFTNSTAMELRTSRPMWLETSVFDLNGKRLRTLLSSNVMGARKLFWDGTDARGRIVPAGIYWVKVTSGQATLTRKVLFLK